MFATRFLLLVLCSAGVQVYARSHPNAYRPSCNITIPDPTKENNLQGNPLKNDQGGKTKGSPVCASDTFVLTELEVDVEVEKKGYKTTQKQQCWVDKKLNIQYVKCKTTKCESCRSYSEKRCVPVTRPVTIQAICIPKDDEMTTTKPTPYPGHVVPPYLQRGYFPPPAYGYGPYLAYPGPPPALGRHPGYGPQPPTTMEPTTTTATTTTQRRGYGPQPPNGPRAAYGYYGPYYGYNGQQPTYGRPPGNGPLPTTTMEPTTTTATTTTQRPQPPNGPRAAFGYGPYYGYLGPQPAYRQNPNFRPQAAYGRYPGYGPLPVTTTMPTTTATATTQKPQGMIREVIVNLPTCCQCQSFKCY